MTIIFKTRDGRTVETTDKNVLFAAAKNGEIGPDTVVTIDGAGIEARRIKGLVFGAPAPAPEPPKPTPPAPAPKPAEKEKLYKVTVKGCTRAVADEIQAKYGGTITEE